MKTTIIIPFLNKWDLTHRRLTEIYTHLRQEDIEVVLVDDASTDADVRSGTAWWQKSFDSYTIRYKRNKENLGFGGSMNVGAKIALKYGAEILVFLSNDVIINGNFLKEVFTIIEKDYKVLVGGEVIKHKVGWNEFNIDGQDIVIPWANGWFLACADVIWYSIGGFDPIYGKTDFEDVDISTMALDLGYNLVALNSNYLQHIGAQTAGYTPERMEHTKHNRELYTKKWQHKLLEIHSRIR